MNKVIPGYSFNFCLQKPVDIEVNNNLLVNQAHERDLPGKAKTSQRPMRHHDPANMKTKFFTMNQ